MPRVPRYSEHELVASDIEDIVSRIAASDLLAAERVLEAIHERLKRIRQAPLEFPRYFPKSFNNNHLRYALCLPYSQFKVFFEFRDDEVKILYIQRGRRDFEGNHLNDRRR